MRFKTMKTTVVAVALAATVPSVINAQEAREPVTAEDRSNDMDFGWLGLLGLAGLFGLKRRDREHGIHERDRVAMNTR